jgi:hypothetical protein
MSSRATVHVNNKAVLQSRNQAVQQPIGKMMGKNGLSTAVVKPSRLRELPASCGIHNALGVNNHVSDAFKVHMGGEAFATRNHKWLME